MRLVSDLPRAFGAAAAFAALALGAHAQTIGCEIGVANGGIVPATGTGGGGVFPTTLPSAPSVFTLNVGSLPPGATVVTEVKMIGLTHTWLADVQWMLTDPSGASHNLWVRGPTGITSCDYNGDYTIVPPCVGLGLALPATCTGAAILPPGAYDQFFGTGTTAWPSGANSILNTPLDSIPAQTGTWTLTAYDWAGGDSGTLTSFDVCFGTPQAPSAPSAAPTLTSPANLAIASNPVTLTWGSVSCATAYDVSLDGVVTTGVAGLSFAAPVLASGTHTWTVRARNASGAGPYATSFSFAVPAPPPMAICVANGAAPGLVPSSGTGGGGVYQTSLPPNEYANTYAVTLPAGATQIVKVDVEFGASATGEHTFAADLQFVLTDPTGGRHNLEVRGGSSCDFNGLYSFYKMAGLAIGDSATICTGSGNLPNGNYNQFFNTWVDGTNGIFNTPLDLIPISSGNWTLTIYDWAGGDDGEIVDWKVCFDTGAGAPCAALGGLGPIVPPVVFENLVPAAWQAQQVSWSGDVSPQNKIDDRIDTSGASLFDILVNFKRVVLAADTVQLEGLSATSSVQMQCRRIPTVAMANVDLAEITQIASMSSVAFIEMQDLYAPSLDVSVEAMKVRSGFYSPNTIEDALPSVTGAGVNIVIMDTGVDNGLHASLTPAPFIGGYDALTKTLGDPDDTNGHGTHVASIALGRQTTNTPRGVAPGASLIDVKTIPGSSAQVLDALEVVYDNRITWNVSVINMSFGSTASQDGTDAFSQLVDLAVAMDIVVVAAAGNSGPNNIGMSSPAAATQAITVAAGFDVGTPNRVGDSLAGYSNRGPRADDGDLDCMDELKPEVTCYGTNIRAALLDTVDQTQVLSGTSMAAPHVAGLAALLRQHFVGISAKSVKSVIIASSDPMGAASSSCNPVWNKGWGWGLVDAYAALCTVLPVDLTFENHPASPGWASIDITTNPFPPKVGQSTIVTATLHNFGSVTANGVRVNFGVHVYSASVPTFYDIGTVVTNVPPGGPHSVSITWIPLEASHQCLKAEISYGCDTDTTNNSASRNVSVAKSPIEFQVRNTLTSGPATIDLNVACEGAYAGWEVILSPSSVTLAGSDPPVTITALAVPPLNAPAGATVLVHVSAKIGSSLLGGVSFYVTKRDCNGNSVDDYFDIQTGVSLDANGNGIPDECDSVPVAYCTAGTSTNGCVPSISATGQPSVSLASGCVINVANVEGAKSGLIFYGTNNTGYTPNAWSSFSTSFLCVKAPTQRMQNQSSGGTNGLCDGALTQNWNVYQTANPGSLGNPFSVGNKVYAQAWYRDPPAPKTTNLSDALELTVIP